jgi:sortase A
VIRAAVRTLGELLITVGLFLLLFVSWQLWWTDVEAGREQQAIVDQLRDRWGDDVTGPAAQPADHGEPPDLTAPANAEVFGLVHVPRFGAGYAVPVHEGTGLGDVLNRGVLGHYPGTAMPGEVGNFAAAGHRTTYGRVLHQIADLQPGDPLVVETADAWYVYRMRDAQIVTPDRVDVVAPVPGQPDAQPTERLLTLTACHPMYSARQRYIVHAVMESWQPKTAGAPAALAAAG